jgi:uncharacterized delta-60 repeat protein
LLIPFILVLFLTFLLSDVTYAQTADEISLQGKIVRNDTGYEGLNVVNGTPSCVSSGSDSCDFKVKYYDAASSGTLEYTEEFIDVEIGDYGGVFNLILGSVTGSGNYSTLEDLLKNEKTLYLQIEFAPAGAGVYSEVFSRTALNASAYAISASQAAGDSFGFYNTDDTGQSSLNAVAGSVYYNTDDNELKVYNGSSWVSLATGGSSLWSAEDISSWTDSQYLGEGTEGLIQGLSTFSIDIDEGRASINTNAVRGGLTVYSAYTGSGAWPLFSVKGEKSTFDGTLVRLEQDGGGNIIEAYLGSSDVEFLVDNDANLHLSTNGIAYLGQFSSDPGGTPLDPGTGEGCIYAYGDDLYWDPACDSSGEEVLNGGSSSSLWTDGGTFTYLTDVDEDLVLGGNSTGTADFFFDVSAGRLGIGTDTPQASIDIAGASSEISNTTGDITIDPADQLVVLSDVELGNGSTTRSLYAYNAARSYYGQIELYNLATGNMTLNTTFDSGDIILDPGSSGGVGIGTNSPDAGVLLDLESSSNMGTTIALSNIDTGGHNWYLVSNGSSNYGGAGSLQFYDYTEDATRLLIDPDGNVGIGNTNPNYTLEVAGDAKISYTTPTEFTLEDFEGSFLPSGWTTGGDADWIQDSSTYQSGSYSANSGDLNDYQESWVGREYTFISAGTIKFYWKVSSEEDWDYLLFCVNNDDCDLSSGYEERISGTVDWTEVSYTVDSPGIYSFRWKYVKDGAVSEGTDEGWIDNIRVLDSTGGNLYVDNTLGIGTTNPSANLSVQGSITGGRNATTTAVNNFTFGSKGDVLNREYGGADDTINAVGIQSNGKIVIGGEFTTYNGITVNGIARLNSDGSLDTSFNSGVGISGSIQDILIQSDDKILIVGEFFYYNFTSRPRIARLNSDGSLDTSFSPGIGFNNAVHDIVIQSDGKFLVGGSFSSYNGTSISTIARINSDGSLDTSFDPGTGVDNTINTIELQSNGKILIGGYFTDYNGTARSRLARLNSDGSIDTSLDSSSFLTYNSIEDIAVQSDGKILIGGSIFNYSSPSYAGIMRVNTDGTADSSFTSGGETNADVKKIYIQDDGKILIAGNFSTYDSADRSNIALMNSDGSVNTGFDPDPGAIGYAAFVNDVAIQSDDKMIIAGKFTAYNSTAMNKIARIETDASLDISFSVFSGGFGGSINSMVKQDDGKIIVAGNFLNYNNSGQDYIVRLNSDGSLDTTFDVGDGPDSYISKVKIQSDGKVVIIGGFANYDGISRIKIARLNADGSLDTTFNPGTSTSSPIYDLAIQSDGKIVIGGFFTSYNGTTRNRLARINSDGSLDTSFDPGTGASSSVSALAIQSDGKIVIGGFFTSYNGTSRNYIARVNTDGSLDTGFDPGTGADSSLRAIAIQGDGKIIISGYLTSYNGTSVNRLARLNTNGSLDTGFDTSDNLSSASVIKIKSDGKILLGGYGYILLLDTDGTAVSTFNSGYNADEYIYDIVIQDDTNLLVGGTFSHFDDYFIQFLVRLDSDGEVIIYSTVVNDTNDSLLFSFGFTQFQMNASSSSFTGLLTLTGDLETGTNNTYNMGSDNNRWKNIYAEGSLQLGSNGDSGSIRYNTTNDELEFSNDGVIWIPLADAIKTVTLSSEYAGAVLAADGTSNTGFMTSDAEGSSSDSMNYYEWNSSETSLQDYDVRLRYTIPSDFSSWGTNAFTLNFATEAAASTNNKVDIYVYEESSGTVDDSSTDQYSNSAGVWQTTNIQGADLGDCNSAGETCLILIRMYSANDNYVRIGDIDVNYTRKL